MKTQDIYADNTLTILLEGQIDSSNALQAEKDIYTAIENKIFSQLYIDCANLTYITSAGLRILLGVFKKYPSMEVINVSTEVYEILEMTGFTQILHVHRALREISVEGCPVVGEGFTATVYRIAPDTIVKVFKGKRSMADIQTEIDAAKKAFIYGIPTAISFDIVKVEDRYGVVFEMLDCKSLRDLIVENPEYFEQYKKMYADLSYQIVHTDAADSGLAECKGPLLEKFRNLSTVLSKEKYDKLVTMIKNIKDTGTLTHGDFHIKNILVQNGEPVLIDMDAVSIGNPIFELEGIYLSSKAYGIAEPNNCKEFFGVEQSVMDELYDALVRRYFENKTEAEMQVIFDKIKLLGTAHLAYQTIRYKKDVNGRLEKALATLNELLDRYDDLNLFD